MIAPENERRERDADAERDDRLDGDRDRELAIEPLGLDVLLPPL
jgi:hypothetical protein